MRTANLVTANTKVVLCTDAIRLDKNNLVVTSVDPCLCDELNEYVDFVTSDQWIWFWIR